MMGCFMGCLCPKKRIKQGRVEFKPSENLKQVEISMEDKVAKPATTGPSLTVAKVNGKSSVLDFNLEDLLRASAEVLGRGTLGTTYKASLDTGPGPTMVVKRIKDFNFTEEKFVEIVEGIEMISHENLFPLKAYYYSKDERLLVYDYMPMGSLSAVLHGNKGADRTQLNWDTRIGIALGAARAIAHLHSQDPLTYHGSIKSSNVLLTSKLEARVCDYGVTRFHGPVLGQTLVNANRVDGYRAPEVIISNVVSQATDVYSYGVLFLELLTGKDPNGTYLEDEGMNLPRWMSSAINDEWTSEVFDVELLQHGNLEELMLQLLELAFSCTSHNPYNRPSMEEVITGIEILCSSSSQIDETHAIVKEEESSWERYSAMWDKVQK